MPDRRTPPISEDPVEAPRGPPTEFHRGLARSSKRERAYEMSEVSAPRISGAIVNLSFASTWIGERAGQEADERLVPLPTRYPTTNAGAQARLRG